MRFSLRFFVIELPLLLVLVYAVIWNVEGYHDHITTYQDNPWSGNNYEIDNLLGYLHTTNGTLNAIKAKDLNLWIAGKLTYDSPLAKQLKPYDSVGKQDSWDHLYVAVDLDKHKKPTFEPGCAVTVGIYSRGADGVSNSHGCDPDDIASWRIAAKIHETRQDTQTYWRDRKYSALRKLLIGSAIIVFLYIASVVGYRSFSKNTKTHE